jgi:hypothetical protein
VSRILVLSLLSLSAFAQPKDVHVFSTLFTAQNVRDLLSTEAGIDSAIAWCRKTAVTKVYIETFRTTYQADRAVLANARRRFLDAGFDVSGCVTTTRVGKISNGWNLISCYTDRATQDKLQAVFEYTAGLFDEIMIDDFWFTDCTCAECDAARGGRTWEDYRRELMTRVSRDRIIEPARRVNPRVKIIIKYPQWYDRFHERGYDVDIQTRDFDKIWVGTETRDVTPKGGRPQYEAYFIMRWLGAIGGAKTGGGWFDPYDTTPKTYIEQARQTVLAGARESVLFCYGSLLERTGPENVEALRLQVPELLSVAGEVRKRTIRGVAAYKPPNSHAEMESYIFDNAGMMGLPLAPTHEFPEKAPAAFFSIHALKDPEFAAKLARFVKSGKPVLITDNLAARLEGKLDLKARNVQIVEVGKDPNALNRIGQPELDRLRAPLLAPLKTRFEAPNNVGLYLFTDSSWVIENFTDGDVQARLNGKTVRVPARGWKMEWKR